jgi:Ca2+-binding RTX toxin-like protein
VLGEAGNDILFGGPDRDSLFGDEGDDTIYGGKGNDSARGGVGKNQLFGNQGNDTLIGGADNESLFGGTDDDSLFGAAGDDVLSGDRGRDTLTGGDGNDTFIIGRLTGGLSQDDADVITDFTDGSDRIRLTAGLGFADLTIIDGTSGTTPSAIIQIVSGNDVQYLAVLPGVSRNLLTSSDFTTS